MSSTTILAISPTEVMASSMPTGGTPNRVNFNHPLIFYFQIFEIQRKTPIFYQSLFIWIYCLHRPIIIMTIIYT